MDMSEDCWAEHVGLLQVVPGATASADNQPPAAGVIGPDFLVHHHHEVRRFNKKIFYFLLKILKMKINQKRNSLRKIKDYPFSIITLPMLFVSRVPPELN